ncbi:MAG: hypothetical protein R3291_00210 [Thermoplasmata archaeon]|nr:hypothetical protein [Thermoplasmata archaeon]
MGFFLKDLKASVFSPRVAVAFAFVAFVTLGLAWLVAQAAVQADASDMDPATRQLWQRGADGALSTLAFFLPVILPVVAVTLARQNLESDATAGLLPLALSKPAPNQFMAGGKAAGMVAALAVPLIPLSLAAAFLIQALVGEPLDPVLVAAFVGGNLVLAALYLLLGLVIGTALSPGFVGPLAGLVWLGSNLLRPTAFVLLGVLIGAVRVEDLLTFEYAWTDVISFTGLEQGILAAFTPADLMFVVWPMDSLLPQVVVWANAAWIAGLLLLFAVLLAKVPER